MTDAGTAELIAVGKVKVKQGVELKCYTKHGVVFTDDSELEADAVFYA